MMLEACDILLALFVFAGLCVVMAALGGYI